MFASSSSWTFELNFSVTENLDLYIYLYDSYVRNCCLYIFVNLELSWLCYFLLLMLLIIIIKMNNSIKKQINQDNYYYYYVHKRSYIFYIMRPNISLSRFMFNLYEGCEKCNSPSLLIVWGKIIISRQCHNMMTEMIFLRDIENYKNTFKGKLIQTHFFVQI